MTKTIILSTKFTKTDIEIRWVSPPHLNEMGIKEQSQPDSDIVAQLATTMEWLKTIATKNNLAIKIYINDKLIVDRASQDQLNIN